MKDRDPTIITIMNNKVSTQIKGAIIVLIAGTLWGFSGTCSQFLFQDYGISPIYLTNVRMVSAGAILVGISLIKYRPNLKMMLTKKNDRRMLFAFAFLGILFNQLAYLMAISHTNSGTATILQYVGPVLIMVVSCFMARRLPTKIEVFSIVLVIIGTWLMATHGDFTSLYITPAGLIWGLVSALAVVFYTMMPVGLIQEYGSIPAVGSGMLIGGLGLTVINRFQGGPASYDQRYLFYLAIIIILGTVIPYTAYLLGVSLCGAVKASMIASIEPVSATLCMVIWLGEKFYGIDAIGFACILLTVFLLAKEKDQNPPLPEQKEERS